MLTLEEIKHRLEDLKLTRVSEKTGVSYQTIVGIKNGHNVNPNYKAVLRLSDYLERTE